MLGNNNNNNNNDCASNKELYVDQIVSQHYLYKQQFEKTKS